MADMTHTHTYLTTQCTITYPTYFCNNTPCTHTEHTETPHTHTDFTLTPKTHTTLGLRHMHITHTQMSFTLDQ